MHHFHCHIRSYYSAVCGGSQVNAEIIITFEGTTESGNDFMARQSYLPNELKWGHCFSNMLSHPSPGTSQYVIDFSGYLFLDSGFLLFASQLSSSKVGIQPATVLVVLVRASPLHASGS